MSITTNLKLDKSIIPCTSFLWYREQELVCPIDFIKEITPDKLKELYDIDVTNNIIVLVQRHISDTAKIYVCLHSLMYYELHKHEEIKDNLLIVPHKFLKNMQFSVKIVQLNDSEIKEITRGLKLNDFATGSVFIHDCAFSPPGCLHFKVNNEKEKNEFMCYIKCEQLNINIECLFILFNDLKGTNIDNSIKEFNKRFD